MSDQETFNSPQAMQLNGTIYQVPGTFVLKNASLNY